MRTRAPEQGIHVRVWTEEAFRSLQTFEDTQPIVYMCMCTFVQKWVVLCRYAARCVPAGADTCQSVTFDLSIMWTISELLVVGRQWTDHNSCFARFKCNSCLQGTKFHSLPVT